MISLSFLCIISLLSAAMPHTITFCVPQNNSIIKYSSFIYKTQKIVRLVPLHKRLLFTVPVTSNASRHFKSPLAMGEMPFKTKRASSVSISIVIDTGVNSNHKRPLNNNSEQIKEDAIRKYLLLSYSILCFSTVLLRSYILSNIFFQIFTIIIIYF